MHNIQLLKRDYSQFRVTGLMLGWLASQQKHNYPGHQDRKDSAYCQDRADAI